MKMSKSIAVFVKRAPTHEVDGTIHRRRVVVLRVTLDDACQPISPVDFCSVPHQQGGDVYKGSFHFRRRANRVW